MSSHLVLSGIDDAVKARLEKYWEEKLPRVQRLLLPYPTDLREIRLTVSHHQDTHRSWYEGRAVIHLPTGTLAAEANDKDSQVVPPRAEDAGYGGVTPSWRSNGGRSPGRGTEPGRAGG